MENIEIILNIMGKILNGELPEKLLPLLPYNEQELADYYDNIAPNDTMGFFLSQLENWFYEHENVIERENSLVFKYWQDVWADPLFEKTESAFYYGEPKLWQEFLDEMREFVAHTKQIMK